MHPEAAGTGNESAIDVEKNSFKRSSFNIFKQWKNVDNNNLSILGMFPVLHIHNDWRRNWP